MIFLNIKLIKFHAIPWNSMKLEKVQWNFEGKLEVPWNSMDFHGTREYGKAPWNSMELWIWEKSHGIPWNLMLCCLSSMEFHGTRGVVQMLFKKFHGTLKKVSWNIMIKTDFNGHWKEIWIIFWYVQNNAGNSCGIMQILIIKQKFVKETYKKI